MQARLQEYAERAGLIEWHVSADSTIARVHQHVTNVTAGQDKDSPMLVPLLGHVRVGKRTCPTAVLGDKAYSPRANRIHLRERGIEDVIPEPRDQVGHRKRRGSKGGRPPKLNLVKYRGRNVIERG